MDRVRVFAAFDTRHDADLHAQLARQCEAEGSPLCVVDASRPGAESFGAEPSLRARIADVDFVVVLCGEQTASAAGVAEELRIARELGKPYLLLRGRRHVECTVPASAGPDDAVYTGSWPAVTSQIGVVMRRSAAAAAKRGTQAHPPPA